MKRIAYLMFALALLIGMGVTANALAGDTSGSMVYRWQGMNNMDQDSDLDDAQGAGHMRTRVTFAGDVDHNASYNLTVENYQIFGDAGPDANSIYQATFTMKDFLFEDFDVTLGRMPVAYGRERVIGVEDWDLATNILFEGLRGRYSFESGWLDFFNFKLIETFGGKYVDPAGEGDTDIMGLYLHYDASPDFYFEPYVITATTENWADPDIDNDSMFMFGGLFDYIHEGIHFYGEVVAQSGTMYVPAEMDQSALGYYAGLFYDFESEVEPYIGFEYNYASGDDITTAGKDEGFGAPFGSVSDFLGIMNVVDWCDVTALRFAGGFTPTEGLTASADFFLFTLAEAVGGDDAIGNEIDIMFDYLLNDDVDLEAGLGMFSYDEKSTMYVNPGDSRYFVWAGASLDF
ncbi:alginate export family protein [bacterium]|nr:alginate export family protein [bacterium]MBU1074405.1 alginate export family protein [bacterium]MBU1676293.1 alginate export family protein [bacterium]